MRICRKLVAISATTSGSRSCFVLSVHQPSLPIKMNNTSGFNTSAFRNSASSSSAKGDYGLLQGTTCLVQTIVAFIAIVVFFRCCSRHPSPRPAFIAYPVCVVIGDLLFTMYSILLTVQLFIGYWPLGERACSFMLFLVYEGGVAVLYGEVMIAINRIWAVFAPHHYRIHHTKRVAWFLCAILWLATLVFIVPFISLDDIYRTRKSVVCTADTCAHPIYSNIGRAVYNIPVFLIPAVYVILAVRRSKKAKVPLRSKAVSLHTSAGNSPNNTVQSTASNSVNPQTTVRSRRPARNLAVLAWVSVNVVVFWGPTTTYQLLFTVAPQLVSYSPAVLSWVTTWNYFSHCSGPLVFVYTVLRFRQSRN